jgi:hypothetical protein
MLNKFGKRVFRVRMGSLWLRFLLSAILTIPLFYAYTHSIQNKAYVEIVLTPNVNSRLQIFWAGANEHFSEERSKHFVIYQKKRRVYGLYLTDLDQVRKLRIDPLRRPGAIEIEQITIQQEEFNTIQLSTQRELKQLTPNGDVAEIDYKKDRLILKANGVDPQLNLTVSPKRLSSGIDREVIRFGIVFAAIYLILSLLAYRESDFYRFPEVLLCLIIGLIVTMATVSKLNSHPDENVHARAAAYYEDHWLPPVVCDPATEHTYSPYGVSRLNTKEITYFIAGKLSRLFNLTHIDSYLKLRYFNCLLFIGIIFICIHRKALGIFFVPLLVSPQIWYVFSYFSSDAFSLFLVMVVSYQIAYEKSALHSVLKSDTINPSIIVKAAIFGLLIGSVYFLKLNYYVLFGFWSGYIVIEKLFQNGSFLNVKMKPMALIVLSALLLFVTINGAHLFVNGFDRNRKIVECQDKLAKYPYKPSTPLNKQWVTLNIKAKGLPVKFVLDYFNWGGRTFTSSFGIYGYTNVIGSPLYYNLAKYLAIIFLAYITFTILAFADIKGKVLLLFTLSCTVLTVTAALLHSWVVDIQAQGRYLLPVLPMFGICLYKNRKYLNKKFLYIIVSLMFLLSLYSFIFVGLKGIPKL